MRTNKNKQVGYNDWLRISLLRVSRAHFLFLIAYAAIIVIYDATKVLTPDMVLERWIAFALTLAAVTVVWYLAHSKTASVAYLKQLTFLLIAAGVAMSAYNVYAQRGMASRAVMLFAIPIITSAIVLSRSAIFAVATFSAAAYVSAAILYSTHNFNEGYKTELYGEVGFYVAIFYTIASLLATVIHFGNNSDSS